MGRILVNMPSQYGGKPSGVALVTFRLLEKWLASGAHDYVLRSPWTRAQLPSSLQSPALEVVTIPRPRVMIAEAALELVTIPAYCRKHGIGLVLNADLYGAARGGRARVTIVHDLYFRALPKETGARAVLTQELIARTVLAGSARLVCVSDATREDLCRWFPGTAAKARTIHSDAILAPVEAGSPPLAGRYVMIVGNTAPNKNFALAGRAFALIADRFPDLRLLHVGDDPHETVAGALGERLAGRLVRMRGVGDEALARLYAGALCLCVPSLYEGFCLPILEAQACDCPVLSSDRSAMPEIGGEGALYFDPEDPAALAGHISALVERPECRRALVAAGSRNRARFSWDAAARAYEALFAELLAR